jgi:hypothetical protein
MLQPAIGDDFHAELPSDEAPTCFGTLCAAFAPRQD